MDLLLTVRNKIRLSRKITKPNNDWHVEATKQPTKVDTSSYMVRYPVLVIHFTPWQTCSFQCHKDVSGKHSATLQLLREEYSFIHPPVCVAGFSFTAVNCGNVG